MRKENWLAQQVGKAKAEIESWPQWKREALRSEVFMGNSANVDKTEYLDLPGEKLGNRDQCLAFAILSQARGGGFSKPDIRIFKCPDCGGDGFNTGMGVISFECFAEIDGGEESEFFEPCQAKEKGPEL